VHFNLITRSQGQFLYQRRNKIYLGPEAQISIFKGKFIDDGG
jgi:hypothetical protein